MIKIGICTDIKNIDIVEKCGYDYLEASLAGLAAMTDAEYAEAFALVQKAKIKVEACNGMLPATVRVTGPEVNAQKIHDYLDMAFDRAAKLGVKVVVFGSSGARNVPEGFNMGQAWRQISNFLRLAQPHAQQYGITIAIEPLRRGESNIINLVSEGTALAALLQLPNIRTLGDTYHMAMCSEPLSALTLAGDLLAHVHTANALGRILPKEGDGENYMGIFQALKAGGYEGRISCEAGCKDFAPDAQAAFDILDKCRKAVYNN